MTITERGKRKQTIQDLEASRDIIEKYGWIQGDLGNTEQGFCMMGAIDQHIHTEEHDSNPGRFYRAYKTLRLVIGHNHISEWNDKEGRTKEEVITAFNQAITELARI